MGALSLHSRRCVLGDSASSLRLAPARVVLDGPRIGAVIEGDPDPGDHRLGDQVLAPAFVNAHTHLALHACRGLAAPESFQGNLVEEVFYRVERHMEPADVEAFVRVAALECLLSGTGVVYDHYYHAGSVARAARDCRLAAVVAPTLQDRSGPGVDCVESALETTVALDDPAWREAGIVAAVGPHATDTVSGALWRRALDLAEARGLVVHAHLAQSAEEAARSLAGRGRSPVAWLEAEGLLSSPVRQLFVHALYLARDDLGRLSAERHVLGACLQSQMQFGFWSPVAEWQAAGLPWFVGTDAGASADAMDVQQELRLISGSPTAGATWSAARQRLREVYDAVAVEAVEVARREADATAVRDSRQLLHRAWAAPGQWVDGLKAGVIAPGARAQLIVVDPEHPAMWPGRDPFRGLAFGHLAPAITGVIAGGDWVGEPGNPAACLREPEVRSWMQEATRRHTELMARAGID